MNFTEITQYAQQTFLGNSLQMYALALSMVAFSLLVGTFFRWILKLRLKRWAERTTTRFDDTLVSITERITWKILLVFSIFVGSKVLYLPEIIETIIWATFLFVLVFWGVRAVQDLIEFLFIRRVEHDSPTTGSRSAVRGLMTVLKYALWLLGFLLIASNLGINITSLIAGLGVGGVAVAFALQNILEDLFSSFALYFDRPFEVGDFIVVGQQSGTVERIGVKTTRLRALQGEQIVISNRELTTAQVQNFKKLEERRVVIRFGVTYETTVKQREAIPQMVQEIVDTLDGVRHGRTHLDELGDSALVYETVYFVEDSDFDLHMDRKQEFLFALLSEFAKKKIDFAYPTQTVHISKS